MDIHTPLVQLMDPHARELCVTFTDLGGVGGAAVPLLSTNCLRVTWHNLYLDGYHLKVVQQRPGASLKFYFYSPKTTLAFRFKLPAAYVTQSLEEVAWVLPTYADQSTAYHSTRGAPVEAMDIWEALRAQNDALAATLTVKPKPSAEVIDLAAIRALMAQKAKSK